MRSRKIDNNDRTEYQGKLAKENHCYSVVIKIAHNLSKIWHPPFGVYFI